MFLPEIGIDTRSQFIRAYGCGWDLPNDWWDAIENWLENVTDWLVNDNDIATRVSFWRSDLEGPMQAILDDVQKKPFKYKVVPIDPETI